MKYKGEMKRLRTIHGDKEEVQATFVGHLVIDNGEGIAPTIHPLDFILKADNEGDLINRMGGTCAIPDLTCVKGELEFGTLNNLDDFGPLDLEEEKDSPPKKKQGRPKKDIDDGPDP